MPSLTSSRLLFLATMCAAAISVSSSLPAEAQYFGVFDRCSPLVWYPGVEGEVRARLMWVHIASGSVSGPEGGGLRNTFRLDKDELFLDSMARFQVSRISVRTIYEPRDFAGFRPGFATEARLAYSGFRLGGDLDIIQCNKTRLGLDLDYDFFTPQFTYPSNISPFPHRVTGTNALTMGVHGTYNPLHTVFGVSGLIEARVRWPITGTAVTDWEIAGGLASPSTLMGSWSFTAGYRNTRISFRTGGVPDINFDADFEGWFTELAFYY